MATAQESRTYWSGLARGYSLLGAPLRPSNEDIRGVEQAIAGWRAAHPTTVVKALLLGVTPGIAEMELPEGSYLFAVDSSAEMVASVWPGDVAGRRSAVCSAWNTVPLRSSSVNVAIGDGSFSCLGFPDHLQSVVAELRRALTDDGILIVRCYIPPPERESPSAVIEDMLRGAIATFHAFKFRLVMSMQQSPEEGVGFDEVYRYWIGQNLDVTDLARRTGWPVAEIRTMELYRSSSTVVTYLTLRQLRTALAPFFDEITLSTPSYPLGERCPILIAKPKREANCTP